MYSNLSICKFSFHFLAIPFVWLIIYGITATYTYYIYYNESALKSTPFLKNILNLIFYFCSLMTLICHTMSMYTDPGLIDSNQVAKLKNNQKNYCKKCKKFRPLRAHHCSTCKKCIMKMDHHCPWVFNCVGYGNQKIFFLFLMYATTGCGLAFFVLCTRFFSDEFSYMLRHPKYRVNFDKGFFQVMIQTLLALSEPLMLIMGTALAFSMTVAIGGLFGTQIHLISRNMTGVEHAIYDDDHEQNPWYAKKDRWFMFKTVLGLNERWKWFFPIVESNKYNSGYLFDTPYERIVPEKKKKEEENEGCCSRFGKCLCCCIFGC